MGDDLSMSEFPSDADDAFAKLSIPLDKAEPLPARSLKRYVVLAVLAGWAGGHNLYARRYVVATVQAVLFIGSVITLIALPADAVGADGTSLGLFLLSAVPWLVLVWVGLELFWVRTCGDGAPLRWRI